MKKGFTLAEVLITLAIIGVVAAMTIPTLIANYQKKTYVTQLQKTYSMIANAAKMVMADEMVENLNHTYLNVGYNGDALNEEKCKDSVGVFLNKYFRVIKDCGYVGTSQEQSECLGNVYYNLKSGSGDFHGYGSYCVQINTGATICMDPFDDTVPAEIIIDVNGPLSPNVIGRDTFMLDMNYRGEIAESFNPDDYSKLFHQPERCGVDDPYGFGCFNKIVEDGWKMDY